MKKKVLIFIDWYLPGYKAGGPIQSVSNMVVHLKNDFDFSIVTRDTDYCETEPYKEINSDAWNILPDGTRVYYFSTNLLTRSNIRNLIRKENFDCVYLNGIYSLYFTLYPLLFLRKKHDKRIVIAARGMLSEGSLNVKSTKKQFFLRAVKVLRFFDKVIFHATTQNEKQDIQTVFGNKIQIKIAPNLPQKISEIAWKTRAKNVGELKLVNIARISPEKNLLFALKVLKEVKSNVMFDIYGPVYSQEYWKTCQEMMKEKPLNVKVNYKGSLEPQKVLTELENYHFMFMPTTGENFGHIILQSFASGCPVIISDQTPWKKLEEKKIGWDISLEKQNEFVNIIEDCVRISQVEYDEFSKHAYTFAKNYLNDDSTVKENMELFM